MIRKKSSSGRFEVRNATVADVNQMAQLQIICFPTLMPAELLTKEHYINHLKIFPEGQFVVMDNDTVIASSSTLRIHFPKLEHTLMEATDNLWITNTHLANGDWLYQFDIGVLPSYRGLGLSKELYSTQQDLARSLGMKGQVTVGMTIGYAMFKKQYSIEEYCEKLKNHEISDPTITPQRKAGFEWIKPIYNYIEDPAAGNCCVLMVWPLEGVNYKKYLNG